MDATQKFAAQLAGRRGGSVTSFIGLLAAIALVVGYFLPWTSMPSSIESVFGLTKGRLIMAAPDEDDPADEHPAHQAVTDLVTGGAISGSDWARVLRAVEEEGDLDDAGKRRLEVAEIGVRVLPFAAGGLAFLLLLMSVSAGAAMRVGFAPVALVLRLAQSNFLRGLVLVLTMVIAAIVFFVAHLLWLGVSVLDATEGQAGTGIKLLSGGSAVAFLSSFLGYGPGRLRSLIWVLILLIVVVVGIAVALST